ncbi:ComF family protein [Lacticaseibacillus brantae]|nr:ComF family protein [Lacticaseibacillus brantae]
MHHSALFTYNTAMKAFIQQYKGLGDYRLHDAFAGMWPHWLQHWTLVPIVSEPGHLDRRGFDPVLGLFADLPLRQLLAKAATDKPQAQKTRAERLQTPQSFAVVQPVSGIKQILLLDDLYTTGRTLYHAKDALVAAGFQGKVQSFSLIR